MKVLSELSIYIPPDSQSGGYKRCALKGESLVLRGKKCPTSPSQNSRPQSSSSSSGTPPTETILQTEPLGLRQPLSDLFVCERRLRLEVGREAIRREQWLGQALR